VAPLWQHAEVSNLAKALVNHVRGIPDRPQPYLHGFAWHTTAFHDPPEGSQRV
jgi:hypothetical protein